jgi:hypothetical protein
MHWRKSLPLLLGASLVATIAVAAEDFKIIRVDDLAKLLDAKTANLYVYDANPQSTRDSQGIIPGAKLLPGLAFDPEKTLPAAHDAKIVFYCANPH